MVIDKFLLNLNVITTLLFGFESIIKKLNQANNEGKKEFEALLNSLSERNLVKKSKKFTKKEFFSIFKNVDLFNMAVLENQICSLLKSIRKKIETIETLTESFEKNFRFLMEYFNGCFGDKTKNVTFENLQKELILDAKRKEIRKFFIFMKLVSILEKMKLQFCKDTNLKKEIGNLLEEKVKTRISKEEFEEDLEEEKHFLQLWIFRPYVEDNNIDVYYNILKEFTKN